LIAAALPAAKEIHNIATKPIKGCMLPGAEIIPTRAVKTTKDITRGFIKDK
jgi:hypothetical protein